MKTDDELLAALMACDKSGISNFIARRISDSKPYYVISELCWSYDRLTPESRKEIALMNQTPKRLLKFESELADAVNKRPGEVIVDISPDPKSKESRALIIPADGGDLVDLKKKSKLVKYINSPEYLTAKSELVVGLNVDSLDVLSYLRLPLDDDKKRINRIRKVLSTRIELKKEKDTIDASIND